MSLPLFSCVIPVKGARPFYETAIASLRSEVQGIEEGELEIIVQDADVEPDSGQSDAFNRGFAKARGKWLFWLNADDVLLPGTLARVKACKKAEWIAGNLKYIDANDCLLYCAFDWGWKWLYRGLPVRVYGPGSFFTRELYERCKVDGNGFDTGLKYMMDIDLWERFRKAGVWFKKLPRFTWGFRVHEGSLTSGDLKGETPQAMQQEYELLDARYGTCRNGARAKLARLVRLIDGSYLIAWAATRIGRKKCIN